MTGPIGVDKILSVFSEEPLPKVKDIAGQDGEVSTELSATNISVVKIKYDVISK